MCTCHKINPALSRLCDYMEKIVSLRRDLTLHVVGSQKENSPAYARWTTFTYNTKTDLNKNH